MRPSLANILAAVWTVFASLCLTRWWIMHPQSFFPLPDSIWEWLADWYQPGCCESHADFEALVTLGVAFIVIMAVNVIGWLTWRRFKRAG